MLLMSGFSILPACGSDVADTNWSSSVDDFVVRYCIHENYTGDTPHSSDQYLFVYSNGTATCQFNSTSQWGSSSTNWTSQLSHAQVSNLYDALISEGFMSFGDSYDDLGWTNTLRNHTERACIEISGALKTVTFHGRSMIGIAPGSFAMLSNIVTVVLGGLADIPDATLDIFVTEPPNGGAVANITANLTNSSDLTLTDSGLCNVSWPVLIVSANGTLAADAQKYMMPYCYMEFAPGTTTEFGPWAWNRTDLSPGSYVIMSNVYIWDYVIGNISSNSSWIPVEDGSGRDVEPRNDTEILYIGLAGIGAALAVGIVVLYVFRVSRMSP